MSLLKVALLLGVRFIFDSVTGYSVRDTALYKLCEDDDEDDGGTDGSQEDLAAPQSQATLF